MDDEKDGPEDGKYLKFTGVFSTSEINKNGDCFQSCEFSGGGGSYQFKFPQKDLTFWQLNPKWYNPN